MKKIYVDGVGATILAERVEYLEAHGKLVTEDFEGCVMPLSRGRYLSPYSAASNKERFSSPYSTAHHEADPVDYRRRCQKGSYQQGGAVAGGGVEDNVFMPQADRILYHPRLVKSAIPDGYDDEPISVLAGSYVLPADIPTAVGRGDPQLGASTLKWMFASGPYGIQLATRARGGATPRVVQIRAPGGAFVIPPQVVRKIGQGDLNNGTLVLDAFIRKVRRQAAPATD